MPILIPLHQSTIGIELIQTVNARELHTFLGPKARFNDWFSRRVAAYGFQKERDFTVLKKEYGLESTNEYYVSLDMAKELSMVERTPKGKEARLYFLDCERQVLALALPPTKALTHAEMFLEQAKLNVALEQRQDVLESRMDAIEARRPPIDRLDPIGWLRKYSKPRLEHELLKLFKMHCRQLEQPVMWRPDHLDFPLPYYTEDVLAQGYEETLKQVTLLFEGIREPAVLYQAQRWRS